MQRGSRGSARSGKGICWRRTGRLCAAARKLSPAAVCVWAMAATAWHAEPALPRPTDYSAGRGPWVAAAAPLPRPIGPVAVHRVGIQRWCSLPRMPSPSHGPGAVELDIDTSIIGSSLYLSLKYGGCKGRRWRIWRTFLHIFMPCRATSRGVDLSGTT